jgi:nitrogen-specific signal transduction histidine kinase/CheY-like chemotaxis protein
LHHRAVKGVIVNARDITERRQAEELQQRLQGQLAQSEKLAALGELLAGVAHELNNPLSVVMGHTLLLERTAADPATVERAAKIGLAAERCGRIVKNFLALARQYPPERQEVRLGRLVREVVEMLGYQLRVDNIEVTIDVAAELPVIWADPHQLQQVLVNLITNAHHAMRETAGPRALTIAGGRAADDAGIWFEVTDTGPGIPPEVERRLFEPFFTTKPVGQGTGLGLSICKGIVEGHSGTIQVEGRPGRGAKFRIEIPIGAPAAPPEAASEPDTPGPSRALLVVDDEPDVARLLEEMLSRDGHTVETAGNGREALDRLQHRVYDAVLTDIKMPELDGPGLFREAKRRHPELRDRFIFLTGDTLSAPTAQFLAEVHGPALRKPFTLRDVRIALRKICPGATVAA